MSIFRDRADAGRKLAAKLDDYAGRPNLLVLGLPRGGVPVAYEVARRLNAPLDVFVVRKLGLPQQPELAMGAIASGGVRVLNRELIRSLGVGEATIDRVAASEQRELARREQQYRNDRPPAKVRETTVILVDDGLATGATMRAAVKALRQQEPAEIIVAVPVASPDICAGFQGLVDRIVCAATPEPFMGVGAWYEEFRQVSDDEVRGWLAGQGAARREDDARRR